MAEVTAFRNNALPYPVYGASWTIVLPILDADGDPVVDGTIDSLVSLNGDTAAAGATPVQIATTSGLFYLILTAANMTADVVAGSIGSTTAGAKRTLFTLYPRKLVTLASGTSQGGAGGYITLAAGTVLIDDQFNGCLCVATIDTVVEARMLQDCTASNQQCTVTPDWVQASPDADDTYVIYLPEGRQIPTVNVRAISDDTTAADNAELMFDGTGYAGGTTKLGVNAVAVSGDSVAADNLEAMFDGTGYIHPSAPSSRDQISSIAGGMSVQEQVDSSTVIQGTAAGAITLMNTDNDQRYVVTDAAAGIDFILLFSPADTESHPTEIHLHGFFNDVGAPFTNTLNVQAYNFNTAAWETVQVLSDAAADQNFDIPLAVQNQAAAAVTVNTVSCIVGDVLVRFLAAATEANNTMNIDHITVGFAGSPLTAAEVWASADRQLTALDEDVTAIDLNGTTIGTVTTLTGHTAQTGDCFPLVSTEVAEIYAAVITNAAGTDIAADIIAMKVDTAAILVDTGTTLDGRIPAALVGGRMDANASAIAGVAAAATNLAASAGVIYIGSVTGAAATTTLIDSALTEAAIDFWKGRIVIFTSGALKYQATDITAFDPATDKLTFTALTGIPGAADTYVIV